MAGNPLTDPDWAVNTTDQVVRLVDSVKSKTTKPAVFIARGLVFGLMAIFIGLFTLVIGLVLATRSLQELLDIFVTRERAVYISYLGIGAVLCLVGAVLFKKRNAN